MPMGFLSMVKRTSVIACITLSFIVVAAEDDSVPKLPYCNPEDSAKSYDKLVYVSTLDGSLSALNLEDGFLAWSIETGPGPMLSSSIHRRELSNNGHWVRMIPSLSGGLYKFNGESIEAVPITADNLLQSSSFIFSDDLLIAGGKESRTYGVEVKTGKLLYECSMKGCTNYTKENSYSQDVIVVQRQTQTVRAVEARSGEERWNFSVGQHDIKYMKENGGDCGGAASVDVTLPFELKIIVPSGFICAVSKEKPEKIIWKHKFDSPIVTAWLMRDGKAEALDLFSGSQWSSPYRDSGGVVSPSLYLGMHKMQLYVQESVTVQKKYSEIGNFIAEDSDYPRIPWNPIPATGALLGVEDSHSKEETALQPLDASATALSVLYGTEYVNGNGYYLFSEEETTRTQSMQCSVSGKDNSTIVAKDIEVDEETPVQVIIVSLWYWWKEVTIISISTAVLLNLLTQRFRSILKKTAACAQVSNQAQTVLEKPSEQHDSGVDVRLAPRSYSEPGLLLNESHGFVSRYLTDFEPIQCLGRGGFGVVFEAKNKIDDCRYAIKRITLPDNHESRERVMREVKALAKLDHHHIVRYFNAWVECPPPGWQQQHDSVFVKPLLQDATSIDLSQLSKDLHSTSEYARLYGLPTKTMKTDAQDSRCTASENTTSGVNICRSASDEDDSFIVFEDSKEKQNADELLTSFDEEISEQGQGDSIISVGSDYDSSQTSCDVTSRRPASLNIRGDGSIMASPSTSVFLYIQMQLCHRESLREWLCDNVSSRDQHKVLVMFEQIVQAVEYVHLQGLIHRDLKPSNIFFSLNGQIKVGDFGLVTAMVENVTEKKTFHDTIQQSYERRHEKHTAQVGTETYMSPEQLKGLPYDYKVDIYSLGLIFFELLVPFATQMERHRTLMNLREKKFPADFQKKFQDEYTLLRLMLSHIPEERPTTFGIRARPPLVKFSEGRWPTSGDDALHFSLPSRMKTKSFSNSSSVESWDVT
ncbi:eukaryotic translation initiation factor 2-alpha kinase-like [Schistocerca americana]|uniref:eukaryotic translation initiation factor 2-alpha kinase-like n=1 Tax=Schistocerca americana TaxID=7009 RepID=UPI001F4F7125|nr:eukaryotic translation initiation factor 2-alpha kinase-like [Schistocerca americana]